MEFDPLRAGEEADGGRHLQRLIVVTGVSRLLPAQLVTSRQIVDRAVYGEVSVIAVIAGASHGQETAGRVLVWKSVV